MGLMGSTFEATKDLRSGGGDLSKNGDRGRKRKLDDGDAGVEGDRNEVNVVSDSSSVTLDKAGSKLDGQRDAIMEDFERQPDQIASEYKETLESYDRNDELTLGLKRSRPNDDELNQLGAREGETSGELNRKVAAKVAKLSSNSEESFEHFPKETVALKKELEKKDDRINELTLQFEESRATIEDLNRLVAESVARERETSEELKRSVGAHALLRSYIQTENKSLKKWWENQEMGAAAESSNEDQDQSPTLTTNDEDETVPLHQYFNKALSDHFYTTDFTELEGEKVGYVYEGVVGRVFSSPVEGTVGLCRHINARTRKHLYTTEWSKDSDLDEMKEMGYAFDKITCYILISPIKGRKTTALYWSYNSQTTDDLLTTIWEDTGSRGYKRHGIVGYVYESI